MVKLIDVAREARVAPSTVSGVIHNNVRVSEATRLRIQNAIGKLHYHPNQVARGLRINRTKTIGLIVPSITNPFYPAVARGIEDIAHNDDYSVLLCNSDREVEKEEKYIQALLNKQVDGLILAAPVITEERIIEFVEKAGKPFVVMNYAINHEGVDEIFVNFREAARQMTDYLIELGHRRIVFISGPKELDRSRQRLLGYRDSLSAHGMLYHNNLVKIGNFDYQSGFDIAAKLCADSLEFTAVFASNDLMAIGAIAAFQENGKIVPRDVSVAGFDDIDLAAFFLPQLTTIYNPSLELGQAAVKMILERLRGERKSKVRQELLMSKRIRRSTQAVEKL
jgi:DNA-binding LacI/PurR family transcriptional regulator